MDVHGFGCHVYVRKLECQKWIWGGHILIFPPDCGRFSFVKQEQCLTQCLGSWPSSANSHRQGTRNISCRYEHLYLLGRVSLLLPHHINPGEKKGHGDTV